MNIIESVKNMENKLVDIKNDWLPFVLMFVLAIVFLYKGLFPLNGPQVLSYHHADTSHYFFYMLSYAFDTLSKGLVPLWNPYIYGGTPFVAALQTAVFYPLNCLYLILPINSAINWTIFLHLFLSGIFTYYLLKNYGIKQFGSTVGAIIYIFSAPHIMHIYAGHLVLLATIVWTPLMFLLLDRFIKSGLHKYGIFLSLIISLQLLAGYPQHLFYSLIALSFYLLFYLIGLYDKGMGWSKIGLKVLLFASFIALALFLSAVQILPTAEMAKYSTRANLTYEWVSTFSFPPENLITLLIPDFFGNMITIPYWGKSYLWEMTAYVGILPLLLSLIAILYVKKRTVRFFVFLLVTSLILAMGKYTPLLKLLYIYVPGFNLFRGSSKWIFLTAFSIAVLSGFGADAVIKGFDGLKRKRFIIGAVFFAFLSAAILLLMLKFLGEASFKQLIKWTAYSGDAYYRPELFLQESFAILAASVFRGSVLKTAGLLTAGIILFILYGYKKIGQKIFALAILFIIILDLFYFGMRYMATFDSKQLYWDTDIINFLKQDKEPFRIIAPELDVNSALLSRIQTLAGYDTIMLKRYSEFINLSQGVPFYKQNLWLNITKANKLTDLLNVKYILLSSAIKLDNPSLLKLVFNNGRYSVYQNLKAIPRAFIVNNVRLIKDRDAIFKEIINPDFDPTSYAIVEEEIDKEYLISNRLKNEMVSVRFVRYSPDEIELKTDSYQPGLLILGDVYYPGWKAYIDNEETKIYRANYIMRAITLPEGKHLVKFCYKPASFKIGAVISLLTLVFVVGFLSKP